MGYSASDILSRKELKKEGLSVAPWVSLSEFKRKWVEFFREPQNEEERRFLAGEGVKDFWGDYITSDSSSVEDYLATR